MRVFGFDLTVKRVSALQPVYGGGDRGWMTWSSGGEPFMGAFQQDVHLPREQAHSNWAVFACETLIAGDIGKLDVNLEERTAGIWEATTSGAFSPVLRKPNSYQTWQKFIESWTFSKLSGNAYVLKERDQRKVVVALHVLDPCSVSLHMTLTGLVYYELKRDDLAGQPNESVMVPASEIIHDRMWCLHHPLIGLSPLIAANLPALQGLNIQKNSARFFGNMSRPSGLLTTPTELSQTLAAQYKQHWEENYGPANRGRTAVLGNGLKYEAITQTATDSQLVEQLQLSAEMVCTAYHVPAFKIGVGPTPTYQNAEILDEIYYDTCIQTLLKGVETTLGEGLGLPDADRELRVSFNLDDLIRMDTSTQIASLNESVKGGWMSPNEARRKRNMRPVKGGESPKLQQQNYSLDALARRDQSDDPFGKAAPAAPPADTPPPMKGIETILVGVVDSQKQLELGLAERLDAIDKRFDARPDEQMEGAKRFAEMLKRALDVEPACV